MYKTEHGVSTNDCIIIDGSLTEVNTKITLCRCDVFVVIMTFFNILAFIQTCLTFNELVVTLGISCR